MRGSSTQAPARRARGWLLLLAGLNLLALAPLVSHGHDLILEWRKGPLVYEMCPYSSVRAPKLFWPAVAGMTDLYILLAVLWTARLRRRVGARHPDLAAAVFATLSMAVVLATGEAAVRLVIRKFMFLQYRPHADLYWYNRPMLRDHVDVTDEVPKSTNSKGFRGTWDVGAKEPREVRVFVVGDSSTFGLGVPDDATYSHVLERELAAATGRPVHVINSGCPGHTSLQGLFLLRHAGLAAQPDVVIWAYNNDPCLDMALEKDRIPGDPRVLAAQRLLFRSDLGILFHRVALDAIHRWNADEVRNTFRQEQEGWVRRIPFDDFQAYLAEFERLARSAGSRILFVRMPLNRPMCEQKPIYRTSFDDTYREYVLEFCRREGLPSCDFEAEFNRRADASLFLPGHLFHPSPAGHRIIGGGLARAIVDGGLLPP